MQDLKDVHERIHKTKQEKKKVNEVLRDVLAQSKPYQDVLEELKTLKAKKAQIETAIRSDFVKELEKMDQLKGDIQNDLQLLSDIALSMMMKGETVEITDEHDVKYEPVFKVSFKKAS